MGSSRNNGDQPQEQQQIDTGAQDQSNQFQQMMASQQRARMEQITQRRQRQGLMAQNFGGMPEYVDYGAKMRNEFMGLLAQLGQGQQLQGQQQDQNAVPWYVSNQGGTG